VRLEPETLPPLVAAIRTVFGSDAEVWLFGSRADDSQRGGDIDLYIETDIETHLVARRAQLLVALAGVFGDRKVDIVVRPRTRRLAPIHRIARRQGVRLAERATPGHETREHPTN